MRQLRKEIVSTAKLVKQLARRKSQLLLMSNWPKKPFILAHRGARSLETENTLAAFYRAFELGADGFECDIFLSKDDVPVIMHDEKINRTTQGHGYVWEHTAHVLKQFGVPTLEEALNMVPRGSVINLELKGCGNKSPALLQKKVLALCPRKEKQDFDVIISSFNPDLIRGIHGYALGLLFESFQEIEVPDFHVDALCVDFQELFSVPNAFRKILWTAPEIETARDWLSIGADGVIAEF